MRDKDCGLAHSRDYERQGRGVPLPAQGNRAGSAKAIRTLDGGAKPRFRVRRAATQQSRSQWPTWPRLLRFANKKPGSLIALLSSSWRGLASTRPAMTGRAGFIPGGSATAGRWELAMTGPSAVAEDPHAFTRCPVRGPADWLRPAVAIRFARATRDPTIRRLARCGGRRFWYGGAV